MNRYLIVGNPNTGKTTLFNKLTKSNEKIANYSGVTTGAKSKHVEINGQMVEVVDLPGIYSFESLSEDEVVTKNYLEEHKGENVIYVCASNKIKKNLVLIEQLRKYNEKLIVVVNKFKDGLSADVLSGVEKELGVPVVQVDVRKGVDEIIDLIANKATKFLNDNLKLDKLLSLIPQSPTAIKKLDRLLLHNVYGKIIFIVIFIAVIVISYGKLGGTLTTTLEDVISLYGGKVSSWIVSIGAKHLADFWDKVVVGGIGAVVAFLPQLVVMLSLLFMLEDMGYLPRVGNLFNHSLEKFGMNGKSVFSLIMGVGCTTSAILTTRNVGNRNQRIATVRLLPFVGCSAKIPVILFLVGVMIGSSGIVYAIMSFLTVVVIGFVFVYMFKRDSEEEFFITELPMLKKPSVSLAIKESLKIVLDLFKKIFITVFISSSVLWLLMNISIEYKFFSGEKSLIETISEFVAVVLKPIGLNEPVVVLSLITGLIAKENILSTLGMFGGIQGFSSNQIISFMIFVLSYSPCLPALKCARCEFGKKYAGMWFVVQSGVAYLSSFIFWTFSNVWTPLGFIMLIVFILLAVAIKKVFISKKIKKDASVFA